MKIPSVSNRDSIMNFRINSSSKTSNHKSKRFLPILRERNRDEKKRRKEDRREEREKGRREKGRKREGKKERESVYSWDFTTKIKGAIFE